MIRDTLRDRGLPEDLAFVAMIESGFNPVAVSRAGAKGPVAVHGGTARRYGLRVDQWVDERFDPEKSTLAAAAYLRDLHAQFGSLVAGPGRLQRRRANGRSARSTPSAVPISGPWRVELAEARKPRNSCPRSTPPP